MSDEHRRAETGPMCFGGDWTGLFIRGDNAIGYALSLEQAIRDTEAGLVVDSFTLMCLKGLLSELTGTNEHSGDRESRQNMRPFDECLVSVGPTRTDP